MTRIESGHLEERCPHEGPAHLQIWNVPFYSAAGWQLQPDEGSEERDAG